mmetsp:Transcript_3289/g.6725  ORF Transcript_3289/g.6725 Transcript_3289/m.6725 type:complete len:345 (-) Transcript_3289:217-1251(-)
MPIPRSCIVAGKCQPKNNRRSRGGLQSLHERVAQRRLGPGFPASEHCSPLPVVLLVQARAAARLRGQGRWLGLCVGCLGLAAAVHRAAVAGANAVVAVGRHVAVPERHRRGRVPRAHPHVLVVPHLAAPRLRRAALAHRHAVATVLVELAVHHAHLGPCVLGHRPRLLVPHHHAPQRRQLPLAPRPDANASVFARRALHQRHRRAPVLGHGPDASIAGDHALGGAQGASLDRRQACGAVADRGAALQRHRGARVPRPRPDARVAPRVAPRRLYAPAHNRRHPDAAVVACLAVAQHDLRPAVLGHHAGLLVLLHATARRLRHAAFAGPHPVEAVSARPAPVQLHL